MLHVNDLTEKSDKFNSLVSQAAKEAQAIITHVRFQPTLFVFLGTSSGQIAYRVKKLLKRAYGNVPVLRTLWVDIDTDIDPLAQPWFTAAERAELSGLNPAAVIKNIDNYPAIKEWWPDTAQIKAGMLAGGGAPQQMQRKVPACFGKPGCEKARSVPCWRVTRKAASDSCSRHSASVFSILSMDAPPSRICDR